jgi:hypothetical protein
MKEIPVYSNGDIALPRVQRRRPESMQCENCAWSTPHALKKPNRISIMQRLYVRGKNGWDPIGWYCKDCGSVVLDELKDKSDRFHLIPDPKLTIRRIANT